MPVMPGVATDPSAGHLRLSVISISESLPEVLPRILSGMTFYDPSQFPFATPAASIAREAGALLRHFYEKGVTAEFKGDVDIV